MNSFSLFPSESLILATLYDWDDLIVFSILPVRVDALFKIIILFKIIQHLNYFPTLALNLLIDNFPRPKMMLVECW